jgi:hypothetical protein
MVNGTIYESFLDESADWSINHGNKNLIFVLNAPFQKEFS